MNIRDWMTPNPAAVPPDLSVEASLAAMGDARHLAIVDDVLLGFVHVTDLRHAASGTKVADLALHPAVTLSVDTPVDEVLERLRASRHDAVWLLDDARLVGVFTEHDAARVAERVLLETARVDEVASVPVEVGSVDDLVGDARALLSRRWIRHLPVVESDGQLAGVLSWRDLEGVDPGQTLGSILTRDPWTARWDTPLREVARIMVAKRIGAVPVLDADGSLGGIITRVDLIRAIVGAPEAS